MLKKINPILSASQVKAEKMRPERLSLDEFVHINYFREPPFSGLKGEEKFYAELGELM